MQSAALIEALERGEQPHPVLRMTWETRGYSLGAGIYTSIERPIVTGPVTAVVEMGGWEAIEYGSGIESSGLLAVQTSVSIVDADGALVQMLETYDPRGSAAAMDWATSSLVVGDWEPIFRGVLEDWERNGMITRLLLKTDDAVLRTPVPAGVFARPEWPSADDTTIFGTHLPLVSGIHDAFLITGRGMVPAVNLRYDKDLGYWWLLSVGNLVDVRRVYYDGALINSTTWSILRGVYGGNRMTILSIGAGYQPAEGVVVSFDCEGPDSDGLAAGSAITGPVQQLRMVLEEYVYRNPPLGAWRGDHSIIDDASWDATAVFFDDRGYDCGRRFGGNQNDESAAEVVQSFLDAYPFTRVWWTPLGTLALGVIDPDDVDPDAALWFDLAAYNEGGEVPFAPGDRREVYTHLKQPYMWSSAEQKYLSAYEAHDVAALAEKVILNIDNPWTQARFNNE